MLHEPATPSGRDPAGPYKARIGLWMFAVYTLFYAGFVAINLLSPSTMATIVVAGLNLATVYGMGLIVLALAQALVYNVLCRRKEAELAGGEAHRDGGAPPAGTPEAGASPGESPEAGAPSGPGEGK